MLQKDKVDGCGAMEEVCTSKNKEMMFVYGFSIL